ncbi:ABC transporter permease [Micromonospora sp. NPDC049523]|uniref:ABC transporter permease n=1 Tax=Micromonospora sp. NPDC049523 TaxID=3155921 RepID=UPI003443A991
MANTQLMAGASRATDRRTLRFAGATPRQMRRIVAGEALLTSVMGVTLGTAVPAGTLALIGVALQATVVATEIVVPWLPMLVVAAVCILLSVLARALTARART